jgi:CheY-like chemotaxis protein
MRPTVLVVEDDAAIRTLLTVLINRAGFDADVIESGSDALTLLSAVQYDALVFDLNLPGKSGQELLARLDDDTPHMLPHVVVVSAVANQELARVHERHAAISILRKPFDLQELTDAVTHAVGDAVPVARDLKAEFCRRSIIAGAKAGAVFTLADPHHLTASMHFGYSAEMIDRFAPLRVDSPYPVCVAFRGAHPVWLSVRSMTDEYPEIFRAARANGSDAIAAVPIRRGGETIGAAGWSFREALSFDEKQRARFEEIAEFLATEIGPPLSLTG